VTLLVRLLLPAVVVVAIVVWRRRGRRSGPRLPRQWAGAPAFLQSDVALIAAREVRQRVRGRTFRVVTLLMLAGVAAAIVIPVVSKGGAQTRRVGVVGFLSAPRRAAVTVAGKTAGTAVPLVPEADLGAAHADLLAGRITLAIVDARAVVTRKAIAGSDTSSTARLVRALAAGLGEQNAFDAAGLSASQKARLSAARPLPVTSLQPDHTGSSTRGASIIGVILLFVMLTQYNTWTLIGVMEEKSSRVVEVLLATVRPVQLLAGKVLGIGLLVFTQAGLVVAVALAVGAAVGSDLLNGAGPRIVISTLVWLVLGYAFYSWVYAAAGSMAERQDQVQSLALPLSIPMLVGYILALNVASSGTSSTLFDVLAYLPPTAPFAMPILVGLRAVTWWQFTASALVSVAGTVGVARLAAHVYRRAVLHTGRRVRLREVV
jgi:ABC-2 type transport system permease protein